jgi:hypothetical protein
MKTLFRIVVAVISFGMIQCGPQNKESGSTSSKGTDSAQSVQKAAQSPQHILGDQPDPSFSFAVFDSKLISDLLATSGCYGLRMYNVLKSEGDFPGTVVVVPYDVEECDLDPNDDYYRADGFEQNEAIETKVGKFVALAGCNYVAKGMHKIYSAKFTKAEIEARLKAPNSEGILVMPTMIGQDYTMKIDAISFTNYRHHPLNFEFICQEPCPTVCPKDPSTALCALHDGIIH